MTNQVVPDDINHAANQMHEAVQAVQANIPTDIGDLAAAMPNSASAAQATSLKSTWQTQYTSWVKRAGQHVTSMHSAARLWHTIDHTNAARQEKITREMMGSDL